MLKFLVLKFKDLLSSIYDTHTHTQEFMIEFAWTFVKIISAGNFCYEHVNLIWVQ